MTDTAAGLPPCVYSPFDMLFCYANVILRKGQHPSRKLKEEDVNEIPIADHPRDCQRVLQQIWNEGCSRGTPSLSWCLLKAWWPTACVGASYHLVEILLNFVSPVLIKSLVAFVHDDSKDVGYGIWLAALFFVTPFLQSVLSSHFICHNRRLGFRAQGSTGCMVFEKVLRLSQPSASAYGAGTLVNIMQVDTFRFQFCFFHLNFMWSMPLMLIIGVALLYNNLGVAAFTPLLVMASMYFFNRWLVRRLMETSRSVNKGRDARIKILTEVVHAIRLVKMLAWEHQVEELVTSARDKEMGLIGKLKLFDVANGMVWQGIPAILPLFTFGVYVLLGGQLEPGMVFSSLALIDLVRIPMNLFPQALQVIVQVLVGVYRIQKLLLEDEMRQLSTSDSYLDDPAGPAYVRTPQAALHDLPLRVVDSSFAWTKSSGTESIDPNAAPSDSDRRRRRSNIFGRRFFWQRSAAMPLLDSREGDPEQGLSSISLSPTCDQALAKPDLRIAGLSVPRGKLLMVVGSVGAGKSTLLASLLNEVPQRTGLVEVHGSIAFCSQIAWIMHGTVLENVLLGDILDEARFKEVTYSCALNTDLEELRDGADTVIGERGINLSGGQKARICLARAAFKHPSTDIYILDDPLSAVDMHVAKHLMEECLGSERGLLRQKTRVLVTHQLQFLQWADLVAVVRDGEIVACRPPQDFSKSELQNYGLDLTPSKTDEVLDEPSHPGKAGSLPAGPPPLMRNVSDTSDMAVVAPAIDSTSTSVSAAWCKPDTVCCAGELDLGGPKVRVEDILRRYQRRLAPPSFRRAISSDNGPPPLPPVFRRAISESARDQIHEANGHCDEGGDEVAQSECRASPDVNEVRAQENEGEEECEVGALSVKVWCTYARAMGPPVASSLVLAYLVTNATQLGSTFWLAHWSDESGGTKVEALESLAVYAALSFGTVVVLCSRMLLFRITSLRVSRQLHKDALWAVLRSPMAWLDTTPTGRVINRFSQDLQRIDMELQGTSSAFTDNIVNLSISVVVVAVYVPYLLIIFLPLLLVYNYVQNRFRMTARELQRLSSQSRSPIFQGLDEAIIGVSTIRAYEKQPFFIERNVERMSLNTRLDFSIVGCNRWLATRIKLIGVIPVAVVVLAIVFQRYLKGFGVAFTSSTVGLVLRYALQLTNTMEGLLQSLTSMELCLVALERVTSYAGLNQEPDLVFASDDQLRSPWPSKGEICFDHVTLRYRPSLPTVLNGISFTIPGGTSVGVVGRTGAGKSSLLQALFRMCPLESGMIRIDGQDIKRIGLHTLRKRLAIIPQDPIGFTGSLRFNLDPFNQHSDGQLLEELSKVQLKTFVESQEEGLGYHLTSGGENLSVGQRQLVCAARAFLRNSPILILDEATASVDFQTDSLIQKVLSDEVKTRKLTTLTIAHRINTILGADNVLVMDKGIAAEFGPTKRLANDPASIFYTFTHAKEES
eukprot:TRINITY_DN23320_c0_g1_i2.p1 TRINITY_DN23320_c0_g1~~TRINITY_DN23320_c0_g1_i2.p1  ORF type:complete len:1474 (-),score=167.19 TRINITY_DN23320_c0_g1_i2:114-4469(-)